MKRKEKNLKIKKFQMKHFLHIWNVYYKYILFQVYLINIVKESLRFP